MKNKRLVRRVKDGISRGFISINNLIIVAIILWIFIFLFQNGSHLITWQFITGDYYGDSGWISISESTTTYQSNSSLCSQRYGICFIEEYYNNGEVSSIIVSSISEESPLANGLRSEDGQSVDPSASSFSLKEGMEVLSIKYYNEAGKTRYGGFTYGQSATEMVTTLDTSVVSNLFIEFQAIGGGIRSSLIATFYLVVLSLMFSLPIGVLTSVYLNEYARKGRLVHLIQLMIDTLAGIPSIVFGFVGASVFLSLFRSVTNGIANYSVFAGALTMTMILLPIVTRTTTESLCSVSNTLRQASFALGATRTQTTFRVVIPNAIDGIINSAMISIARIVGESAALMGVMGLVINDDFFLWGSGTESTTLSTHIFVIMGGESPDVATASAIAIIILSTVLLLNQLVKLIRYLFRRNLKRGGSL